MGFLTKIFGGKRGVPEWAGFLSDDEYQAFAEQLSSALAARSLPTDSRAGNVRVVVDGERGSIGFGTLARRCKSLPMEKWAGEIGEYLDFATTSTKAIEAALATDFAAASTKLRIQLVPEGYVRPDWAEQLNYTNFGSGIKAALVYDLPTAVSTVPAQTLRDWRRPWSEVLKIASENVRAEIGSIAPQGVDLGDAIVQQLVGDSYFICSYALWLDTIPGARSERGALVSVPSRHTVLYHPIRDASAWRTLASLPALARDLTSRLPGAISPNLFWIKDGHVVDIPVTDASGQLQVMPPKIMVDEMAGLQEAS